MSDRDFPEGDGSEADSVPDTGGAAEVPRSVEDVPDAGVAPEVQPAAEDAAAAAALAGPEAADTAPPQGGAPADPFSASGQAPPPVLPPGGEGLPAGDGPAATPPAEPPGGGDGTTGNFLASVPGWGWAVIGLLVIALIVLLVILFSGGDSDTSTTTTTVPDGTTTTTTTPGTTTTVAATTTTVGATTTTVPPTTTTVPPTTTTVPPTTTTVPPTTTTVPETTTTEASGGFVVEPTPLAALFGTDVPPYGSTEVIAPGSAEAQWYQWEGSYVALFRGIAATDNLCLGSLLGTGDANEFWTNEELNTGGACTGLPPDRAPGRNAGVGTCGDLVYYISDVPVDSVGNLFGSIELWAAADDVSGVEAVVAADPGGVPEFDPNAAGYTLPPSPVDGLSEVSCG